MNERVYSSGIAKLRSPERLARLELTRVVDSVISGDSIKSVLDIGTGSAVFAEEFNRRNMKVSGIDSNQEMIDFATELLPGLDFKLAKAEELPFKEGEFDAVFMGLVFHEVDNYQGVLKEAFRVSTKSVLILEWNYKSEDFGPPLEHRLKAEFIEDLAKKSGFRNVEIIPLQYLMLYKLYK